MPTDTSAAYFQLHASSEDSGSTKGAITCEDLKRFQIAIPPTLEQQELLKHVQTEILSLSTALKRLEREITLLGEYRTRLIADVVTGKLDVREVAARLPEEELAVNASPEPYDPDGAEGAPEDDSFNSEEG
jgi:type I restriction enzyme S subunit